MLLSCPYVNVLPIGDEFDLSNRIKMMFMRRLASVFFDEISYSSSQLLIIIFDILLINVNLIFIIDMFLILYYT